MRTEEPLSRCPLGFCPGKRLRLTPPLMRHWNSLALLLAITLTFFLASCSHAGYEVPEIAGLDRSILESPNTCPIFMQEEPTSEGSSGDGAVDEAAESAVGAGDEESAEPHVDWARRAGNMIIAVMTIDLHAPWVRSLKEKRMEVKSLLTRIRAQFNVSAAEVDNQDIHQTITLGIAAIAANGAQADSILDSVIRFVEANTDAQVISVEREQR